MREEIQHMRASLVTLISQGAAVSKPSPPAIVHDGARNIPRDTAGPIDSQLSTREDNMHMAMTRENSLEPANSREQNGHGSVTVEEPMGSLYEVTRLRNIRSNRARTVRFVGEGGGELKDFISRDVIPQGEAEDLYRR